jgi:nucleoside-diphosphate-sugar epimerase
VARVLIVGCGCRGQELARALKQRGHAVRGTTRDPAKQQQIAATGAEPWVGDPDRLSTLTRALEGVTVVCWLLANATGPSDSVAALHGERLRAYLRELVDTTVRGFVYEARGSVDPNVLAGGAEIVRELSATWQLPVSVVESQPGQPGQPGEWPAPALDAIERLLAPSSAGPAIGVQ